MAKISTNMLAIMLFGLFGSALIITADFVTLPEIFHQYASKYYSETTGKILYYEIKHYRSSSGHGRPSSSYESVNTHYAYQVNGQPFESKRYRYFLAYTGNQFVVPNYSTGSDVRVFYNPQNPQDAVLERGLNDGDLSFLIATGLFNVMALGFWWVIGIKLKS